MIPRGSVGTSVDISASYIEDTMNCTLTSPADVNDSMAHAGSSVDVIEDRCDAMEEDLGGPNSSNCVNR